MVEDRRSGRVGKAAVLEVLGSTRINCTIACSAQIDITSARINNTTEAEKSRQRINIANQMCSDLKSRVAAPITLPDYASLKEWSDLEPDMMSSSGQLTSTMMGPIRWITDDTEANNTNIYPDRYTNTCARFILSSHFLKR